MPPTLLLVLSLPLLPVVGAPLGGASECSIPPESPAGINANVAPAPPRRARFGTGGDVRPMLAGVTQGATRQAVLLGEPVRLRPAPFLIHLDGLAVGILPDHVVAYLDDRRVGAARVTAASLDLPCSEAVIPPQGCLLRVLVFRQGMVLDVLPPVVVRPALSDGLEQLGPRGEGPFPTP